MPRIAIKRIYDPPAEEDGFRVLVDRVWPRGISKKDAAIDHWAKDIAPSTELRKWFNHDPARWNEFQERYRQELENRISTLRQEPVAESGALAIGRPFRLIVFRLTTEGRRDSFRDTCG
jgi:uncharacterized protein YeaO (DUF488 family)